MPWNAIQENITGWFDVRKLAPIFWITVVRLVEKLKIEKFQPMVLEFHESGVIMIQGIERGETVIYKANRSGEVRRHSRHGIDTIVLTERKDMARRPEITLELRKSHVIGEGYVAHLVFGDERIFIDRILTDVLEADDLHSRLAMEFSKCGIALVEDLET